ncbi:hypothetical protein [Actinoallomurus iriomotensis]|uniref:GH141-like insertion domain-containing protein n=1 Tax=Actinoallomurus iriomotensis TaxID=478107 RepID=A0A9W6W419_9ACTN|nr:hypothetical protein [Actinoallomurus iriomotensis]GLY88551.1 hypothetical protein Airi02_064800 [Actinoallomurus iriomotensis]
MVPLKHRLALVAVAALGLLAAAPAAASGAAAQTAPCHPTEFYVSPNGADSAGGTVRSPWRTVQHARDYIAGHGLNRHMHCDIDVNLRAGDYPVDQTIAFTGADSGSNGHRVVYRSSDGPGKARLLGAKQVTGWESYKDKIYRAQIGTGHSVHTLYEGDRRATTARYPNRGTDETWAPYLRATLDPERRNSQTWLTFKPGVWDQNWDLHDAQVVIWSGGKWSWFTDTDPIKNMSWNKNLATLLYPTRYSIQTDDPGSRYFIQNSLDFLDQAGEYYYDSATGWLYYWPRDGKIDTPVWAPSVQTIVSVTGGSAGAPAHDLTFDGLAFEYTDFVDWYRFAWNSAGDSGTAHEYQDYDRQIELPRNRFGAITLTHTTGVDLHALHVTNTGWEGVYLTGRADHDTISDGYFAHIGGDGVKIEGPYPGEGDIANHNVITDDYFDYYGELVPGDASAVELLDSGSNVVSHSVMQHSARYAVSMRAVTTAANADDYAQGNALSYLKIAHVGEDSGDTGAIYAYGVQNFDPHTMNSSVDQVTIDDVRADPSMVDAPPRGVHMDFGGCGFNFSNIQVTNVQGDQYHGPSAAECNEFANDSWRDGFDTSKMRYDQIGLTAQFPYLVGQ